MNKLPTKLLEYLVKQCTKEVLDQIAEEKLKIKFAKEKAVEFPVKHKISAKIDKDTKFKPKVKKISESDEPDKNTSTPSSYPSIPNGQLPTPAVPGEPTAPEPEAEPLPKPTTGSVLVNPKDKSKLERVKFSGRDERSIDKTLHDAASRIAGPKVKVSLGAKRLAREAASNPNAKIFFYLGKMDPESEEIFLMADKSLQIAKAESVQPTEIQSSQSFAAPPSGDDSTDPSSPYYFQSMTKGIRPKQRYGGIDEQTHKMIKMAINKILDRK